MECTRNEGALLKPELRDTKTHGPMVSVLERTQEGTGGQTVDTRAERGAEGGQRLDHADGRALLRLPMEAIWLMNSATHTRFKMPV